MHRLHLGVNPKFYMLTPGKGGEGMHKGVGKERAKFLLCSCARISGGKGKAIRGDEIIYHPQSFTH